jgi:lysyl-tRNA synthetase class 2
LTRCQFLVKPVAHMEDNEQALVRKQKLAALKDTGAATYPNDFFPSHTTAELHARFADASEEELAKGSEAVTIAGRIMSVRHFGKAAFFHVQDRSGQIQVYVRQGDSPPEAVTLLKESLDVGDIVGVGGPIFRTRTGELTVKATQLRLLSKSLTPLPEKWHGLQDVEARYRQRYLDLIVNPQARETFRKRAKIIEIARRFFQERDFIEVETPMMQQIAGGAAARPFKTHHNTLDIDLFLRIAPELYLKRLVVGGLERVYEINRNFRNEGISTQHNPEFTMLEFYWAYVDYYDLMNVTEELLRECATAVNGSPISQWDGKDIDWSKWTRLSMREAIIKFWPEAAGAAPEMSDFTTLEKVGKLCKRYNTAHSPHMPYDPNAPIGRTIADLFEAVCEEHLFQPTIIYDFPKDVSPLSKDKRDEEGWVERFEAYAGGMEIANAFSELNDPEEQRRRFEQQISERARGDEEAHQMDEDYVRALSYGLPPTGGEGIGIDRITMLMTGQKSIRDVILFPLLRPQATSEGDEEAAAAAE